MLLWGIGQPYDPASAQGTVGRNYAYQTLNGAHGSSMPTRGNCLDLDPTYKDAWGLPLLRLTFDFPENDLRMSKFVTGKLEEIGKAVGGKSVDVAPREGPFDTTICQSTHNTGGAIMGTDPRTSAVNRYLQSWDVPNVFVVGASAFPHNASYNPTGTEGALRPGEPGLLTGGDALSGWRVRRPLPARTHCPVRLPRARQYLPSSSRSRHCHRPQPRRP